MVGNKHHDVRSGLLIPQLIKKLYKLLNFELRKAWFLLDQLEPLGSSWYNLRVVYLFSSFSCLITLKIIHKSLNTVDCGTRG